MAIMQGITGKLSGKMGSAVFRVRKGAQVVAQYNPTVANPKSANQCDARAKFKLASQLAPVFDGVLAFNAAGKAGHSEPTQKNIFLKENLPIIYMDDGTAQVAIEALKLTNSTRAFGTLDIVSEAGLGGDFNLNVDIVTDPAAVQSVVVLIGMAETKVAHGDGTMSILARPERKDYDIVTITDGEGSITFNNLPAGTYTVLAYSIIPSNQTISDSYNNSEAEVVAVSDVGDVLFANLKLSKQINAGNALVTTTMGETITIA